MSHLPLKRPKFVWTILVLYCATAPLTLAFFAVAASRLRSGGEVMVPAGDILAGLLSLIFRGIGTARLFYLKQDCWLYIGSSFAVSSTLLVINFIGDYMIKGAFPSLIPVVAVTGVGIALSVYAYQITNPIATNAT